MARTRPFDQSAGRYDRWFDDNRALYLSELEAVRALLPLHSRPLEIGVGTGRFAQPLGIGLGVEPSAAMRKIALGRGIEVADAIAEDLPFSDGALDLVLMVTTICFLDDVGQALREAHRVLTDGGHILIGFLDRDTELGRRYEEHKNESEFYREARFYSSGEVFDALARAGFSDLESVQTIMGSVAASGDGPGPVEPGYGRGLFVVVRGRRVASTPEVGGNGRARPDGG